MQVHETVCLLIRYHTLPPHAIDLDDARLRLHRMAANSLLTPFFSIKMLCILCKADMLGRRCDDQQQMLDQITLCKEMAKEEECLEGCFPFPSCHTRRLFLSGHPSPTAQKSSTYNGTWHIKNTTDTSPSSSTNAYSTTSGTSGQGVALGHVLAGLQATLRLHADNHL